MLLFLYPKKIQIHYFVFKKFSKLTLKDFFMCVHTYLICLFNLQETMKSRMKGAFDVETTGFKFTEPNSIDI